MAAPKITDIMDGLETRLLTITGLRVASEIPEQINPPVAIVGVPPIPSYHDAFGHGGITIRPTITVIVPRITERNQRQLADYMDPTGSSSIHAAIEADETLGLTAGKVDYCTLESAEPHEVKDVNGLTYWAVTFQYEISARGV